ncbi:hypothetical protein JG654_20010 [Vibrio cholerae]|nr:hypothetical protein [Vibrio cholerae]
MKSISGALQVIEARKEQRLAAEKIKALGGNVDRMLVVSSYDIHRTRLNGFDNTRILSAEKLRDKLVSAGV